MNQQRDSLADDLAATIDATRRAERDVFGAMDPAVRERPIRPGDWSPADHQAHLTAWKGRQADRFAAAREGREIPPPSAADETDAINAELQAARAGWAWADHVREADETSHRLADGIRATDPAVIRDAERLVGGTFGNGVLHALVHFRWLHEAGTGVDMTRLRAFAAEVEHLVRAEGIPVRDRAVGLYDVACFDALTGDLDAARPLLVEAFRLQPGLVEYAPTDADLTALFGELDAMAAQSRAPKPPSAKREANST